MAAAGIQCYPIFSQSPLLKVSFGRSDQLTGDGLTGDESTGDRQITLLSKIAGQVYALNLTGVQVSDQGLAVLPQLKNLTRLHLEKSTITDSGLPSLAQLHRLQYLNLYDTSISDEGLVHLQGLKLLKKLFLWKTKVTYAAAMSMENLIPGLKVNLGHDHPGIVRIRLTKSLERVRKKAEQFSAREAQLEMELEDARQDNLAVQNKLRKIQQQLDQLDGKKAPQEAEKKQEAGKADKEPVPQQEG